MDLNIIRAIQKDSKDAKAIQEFCNKILNDSPTSNAQECDPEYSNSSTENGEVFLSQLKVALELFTLSSKHWSSKRHSLAFDFLRTTLRNINESCDCDALKNETITRIITVFSTFSEQRPQSQIVIDVCSVLVEIATNFGQYLTIQQTIEIIEICHDQIRIHILHQNEENGRDISAKKVFLHHFQALQSKLRPSSFSAQNEFTDPSLEFENFILSDDTVLSAINLAGSQICHAFTKNRIISGTMRNSCSSNSGTGNSIQDSRTRAQIAQDFSHLLAYLSHKLKMKQSFWHTLTLASKTQSTTVGNDPNDGKKNNETEKDSSSSPAKATQTNSSLNSNWNPSKKTAEYFVLVKVYNCFYLKCIHYALLTIPDAWPLMSSQLIEIVW